jgi:hypothetical protein
MIVPPMRWLVVVTGSVALIGCGASSARPFDREHAERKARTLLVRVAALQQRECHERRIPRITHLSCQRHGDSWDCPYSLSDGAGGMLSVQAHSSKAAYSFAC